MEKHHPKARIALGEELHPGVDRKDWQYPEDPRDEAPEPSRATPMPVDLNTFRLQTFKETVQFFQFF